MNFDIKEWDKIINVMEAARDVARHWEPHCPAIHDWPGEIEDKPVQRKWWKDREEAIRRLRNALEEVGAT